MFNVSPASLQTFIDTLNCVLEDRVQYTNYVIMGSDWNCLKYRVIHKSLRNFRTRLHNIQDRHSRKQHINTCKVGQNLGVSLPLLTCSTSAWSSRLLYRRGRKSRRDLRSTLYFCCFLYCNHQVHRDVLITLYIQAQNCLELWVLPAAYEIRRDINLIWPLSFVTSCRLAYRTQRSPFSCHSRPL
jgi:hypothetical protein